MNLFEICLIAIGLSMDAVAVSMSNGMVFNRMSRSRELLMPIFFGFFQGLMPFLGYFAGGLFAELISKYSGIVILIILGYIGGKMVWDGWRGADDEKNQSATLTLRLLIVQAFATSIDAFAVGVGFCAMQINIVNAVVIIGLITFALSLCAILIGKKFGDFLGNKALVLGGFILIFIGLKAFLKI